MNYMDSPTLQLKIMETHIINLLINNLSMGRREQQPRAVYLICVAVEVFTESPLKLNIEV